jgi:hypothetical protein
MKRGLRIQLYSTTAYPSKQLHSSVVTTYNTCVAFSGQHAHAMIADTAIQIVGKPCSEGGGQFFQSIVLVVLLV